MNKAHFFTNRASNDDDNNDGNKIKTNTRVALKYMEELHSVLIRYASRLHLDQFKKKLLNFNIKEGGTHSDTSNMIFNENNQYDL